MEMVVTAEQVDEVVNTIAEVAATGKIGDGKIFVSEIEKVIRIRTGESGVDAI
jgi:nitrogen regulatory protein P-II 1